MYYSLFLGIVSYAISVWGCAYDNILKILQSFQNKILKIIRIDNCAFLNIKQLFRLNSLTYYYDDLTCLYQNTKFSLRKDQIKLPPIHKDIYKKSPFIVSLKLYNLLPTDAKKLNMSNSKALKKKLLDFLLNISAFTIGNS